MTAYADINVYMYTEIQLEQWFSALASMVMLSASTWVQDPPTASGVFFSCKTYV